MRAAACARCGAEFVAQLRTARFCSSAWRAAAPRTRQRGLPEGAAAAPLGDLHDGPTTTALRRDLGDRVDTFLGAIAVTLAKQMDSSESMTGSGLASVSKQFRETLTAIEKQASAQ